MTKEEIFEQLLDNVSVTCKVSRSDIVSGVRPQPVVDARAMFFYYLKVIGLTSKEIAALFLSREGQDDATDGQIANKAKGIERSIAQFEDRKRQDFHIGLMADSVRKFCREEYMEYYSPGMKPLP